MSLGAHPWGYLGDAGGLTCLHYWASSNDVALISSGLLAIGDDVTVVEARTTSTTTTTNRRRSLKDVYPRGLFDVKTLNGETPLHIAIRANALMAVRTLVGMAGQEPSQRLVYLAQPTLLVNKDPRVEHCILLKKFT